MGGGGTPYSDLYREALPEKEFHKLRYVKGSRNRSFRYFKGPFNSNISRLQCSKIGMCIKCIYYLLYKTPNK